MTTHRYRRCEHCKVTYTFQASGWGAPEYNNGRHCPDCYRVICEALRGVPRRAEIRRVDIKDLPKYQDVTLDQVKVWEAAMMVPKEGTILPPMQVVYPGLVDMKTGEWQHIREVVASDGPHKGVVFTVSTWPQNPEYKIEVKMEYNLVEQKFVGRWRDYSNY